MQLNYIKSLLPVYLRLLQKLPAALGPGFIFIFYCMKKGLLGLLVLALLIAAVYIFIPSKVYISTTNYIGAGQNAAFRALTDGPLINKWWYDSSTQTSEKKDTALPYNKSFFTIQKGMLNVVAVGIQHNSLQLESYINILDISKDTSLLQWKTEMAMSNNPFKRTWQYLQARQIKNDMSGVLERLKNFMTQEENVYGLNIKRGKVTDTLLVATQTQTTGYPAPTDYYELIKKLKDYIQSNGAQETDYPMLNIEALDSNKYKAMVAIPINKNIPNSQTIVSKRMVPGNILTADVKGGVHTINNGIKEFNYFISEHEFSSPAISFQSLVTDRLNEPDTSKWITKLCFPVY